MRDKRKERIYEGKATCAEVVRLTRRLGDDIGKVYGWRFPKRTVSRERQRQRMSKRQSGCSDLEAAQEAERIRNAVLDARMDFTFETVLSTERNLELLRRAKQAGYRIHAVFVLTNDPEINVRRVRERVAAGGHDVPEEKNRSRYARSLNNLSQFVRIAEITRIIDNSGEEPNLICEVEKQRVTIWENSQWSRDSLLALLAK